MGTIIKGTGEPEVAQAKEQAKVEVAVSAAPATKLVKMLLFDANNGTAENIEVHPKAVAEHRALGWAIVKE